MLYSLTPPGSVIVLSDPLFLSDSWAGLLAGAAARGSTVAIIAPATANSPNPEPPVMALQRAAFRRLLELRHRFALLPNDASIGDVVGDDPPACCGRDLRLGLYAGHAAVTDVAGRAREVREGLARAPWIRDVIPFDSTALAVLNRATNQAGRAERTATSIAQDESPREPQLHQKTQLIARPGAIATLLRQPGWDQVLAQTLRDQAQATDRLADAIGAPIPPSDTAAARAADQRLQGYERSLSPSDRKRLSFYFALGSFNHDLRGQVLDGEASVVVSGFDASAGLVDLFYLMARTTWIDADADMDRLVPPPHGLLARLARLIKYAL
jgi:phosphatidylserine/phosphatidylglycerophosphate/cardiolipin synthase-like enzyme